MRKIIPILFLMLLSVPAALPQDGVSGPVAGFVFDAALHALRPIMGVPGSSYLGAPLVGDLDHAAVSPDASLALGVSGGRLVLVSGLRGGMPTTAPLDAMPDIDRIAWSPDGALAAVYSSAGHQFQIIRDLRSRPTPDAPIAFDDPITLVAISPAGDLVAGTGSGVFRLAATPRLLAPADRPVAVAFRDRDLFLADASDRILTIENVASAPAVSVFTGDVSVPVGLQVSADGRLLFVASAGSRRLVAYDIAGRFPAAQAELDSAPTELRPGGGRDLWLLNSGNAAAEPLYIATGGSGLSVWFVPDGRDQ
jgi:hypothetical protein